MCSVAEEDIADIKAKEAADELRSSALVPGRTLCQKCRTEPAVLLLRVNDIYCRQCFLAAVVHKFRSTLGKSRLLHPGPDGKAPRVMVAFSGGPASAVLARLVCDGIRPELGNKRLRCEPMLCCVDETAVLPEVEVVKVVELAVETGLPVFTVPLEMVMAEKGVSLVKVVNSTSPKNIGENDATVEKGGPSKQEHLPEENQYNSLRERLQQLWTAASTASAREQLLSQLREQLLARAAAERDCRLLMLAETETRLAVRLLTDIANGRGAHAAQLMAVTDDRHGDGLLVIRPLREISAKQVALYAYHAGVTSSPGIGLDTKAPVDASIGRLTEAFVLGLQEDFPATVSTVYKTGTKLSAVGVGDETCALCRLPLDTSAGAASAIQATKFSELVSASGPDSFDYDRHAALLSTGEPPTDSDTYTDSGSGNARCADTGVSGDSCCGGGGCCSSGRTAQKPSKSELLSCLCYGCQLAVKDMGQWESLPDFVWDEVTARARREGMRREIQDFLIDDS